MVVEELVANHGREVQAAAGAASERKLSRLGVSVRPGAADPFDYRQYLTERFDEVLAITVLPWPDVDHASLAGRAVSRTPPFNQKRGGYRDALVWADVVGIAASGQDVVLFSQDKGFGTHGVLDPVLAAETDCMPWSVSLVDDLSAWLLGRLPWQAADLEAAVDRSRDEQFAEWFLASDFQNGLGDWCEAARSVGPVTKGGWLRGLRGR